MEWIYLDFLYKRVSQIHRIARYVQKFQVSPTTEQPAWQKYKHERNRILFLSQDTLWAFSAHYSYALGDSCGFGGPERGWRILDGDEGGVLIPAQGRAIVRGLFGPRAYLRSEIIWSFICILRVILIEIFPKNSGPYLGSYS